MKKTRKLIVISLIFMLFFLVFWLVKEQKKMEVDQVKQEGITMALEQKQRAVETSQELESLVDRLEELAIPEVDTKSWEAYRSGSPGVEFKYPSGWEVKSNLSNGSYCIETKDNRYAKIPSSSAQVFQGEECIFQVDIDTENTQSGQWVINSLQFIQKQYPEGKMSVIKGSSFGNLFIFENASETLVYAGSKTIVLTLRLWNMDKKFVGVLDVFYGILSTLKPIQ